MLAGVQTEGLPTAEGKSMTLQRLVLTFKPEELVVHALYRTDEGPNPGTKARRRGRYQGLHAKGLERLSAP